MKKRLRYTVSIILTVIAFAVLIVFDVVHISYTRDEATNKLINGIITRLIAGGALLAVIILLGSKKILIPDLSGIPRQLLWCVPCFLVVLANFPFTALIGGAARIIRTDLIALYLLKCFAIGFLEELLFRGILQDGINTLLKDNANRNIFTVLITSALFGVIHLVNLIAGAGVGNTFLQVGYSFLIGAMLSAVIIRTNNLWLCIVLHALFDFGGNIVVELGAGDFQDVCFWIFTVVAGVICFAHVLYFLIKSDRKQDKETVETE